MGANYVLLETITVGEAGASSVTFNNIPQTGYTDIKVVGSTRSTYAGTYDEILVGFNNSTSTFTSKTLQGSGSGATSYSSTSGHIGYGDAANNTASTFTNWELYIPNYGSSNYKSYSADCAEEQNGTAAYAELTAGLWSTTSAIATIKFTQGSGSNFAQYSTFSLYGLAAVGTTPVIAPYASGGDIIQTDGTYWYHAFLSSGTFTPTKALSCDALVVAGGGGGGGAFGSGAGAGGVLGFASQALNANTAQTVTVGAGGTSAGTTNGTNGGNSQFASLTASVGGGAGWKYTTASAGATGGSGGGATAGTNAGGSATSGQGYAGGSTTGTNAPNNYCQGGGGGAGGTGGSVSSSTGAGGAGGAGTNTVTNWGALSTVLTTTGLGVSGYIAGGGGAGGFGGTAGAGGSGGGGAGGSGSTNGNDATPNTGAGGGGSGNNSPGYAGGKGGSGLVIVRYAI